MHELGDFDVEAAVFGDFQEFSLFPPFDGLQAFGGLFDAEGCGGYGVEGEPVLKFCLELNEHVEGWELGEIEDGVTVEDFVIEAEDIETDDEIGAGEFLDEIVDLGFGVDFVGTPGGAIGDRDADAHIADFVPTSHLIGRFLGFDVHVDHVFHAGENLRPRLCDGRAPM